MKFKASFITINYNGYEDTCELIDSIQSCIHNIIYEIIVVDNNSSSNEARMLKEKYADFITVISSKNNLGFAGGNNLAIPYSKGDVLIFINNDTIVESDNFAPIIDHLINNPKIGIICPKIKFNWDKTIIQYAGFTPLTKVTLRNKGIGFGEKDKGQYDISYKTSFVHGACMITKRDTISKTGIMYEGYFLYYEEYDWSERFKEKGFEIWYDPILTIYHKESKSTGINSPLKAYYLNRNRLLFAKRNRKNIIKILCYLYLTLTAVTKFTITKNRKIANATLKGIIDFYKYC